MGKIRVSQHSGRSGSASHNDRSFLKEMTAEEKIEKAAHIDESLMSQNETWAWNGNTEDFKQGELDYYKQTFQAGIDRTNENYIRSRHPERCKKLEDYYFSEKTCPEEMILQIGDKNTEVSKEVFQACMSDYWAWFNQWNAEHGYPCQILNTALHTDETSIHEHIRRVWKYTDDKGFLRLGQNKALKAAGVELPDPSKKESRYNNRKITFDKMAREKWQEICKAHGFDIETDPRPNVKHKDKAEFIADQMEKEQLEREMVLELVNQDIKVAEDKLQETTDKSKEYERILDTQFKEIGDNSKTLGDQGMELFRIEDTVKQRQSFLSALPEQAKLNEIAHTVRDSAEAYLDKIKVIEPVEVIKERPANKLLGKPATVEIPSESFQKLQEAVFERDRVNYSIGVANSLIKASGELTRDIKQLNKTQDQLFAEKESWTLEAHQEEVAELQGKIGHLSKVNKKLAEDLNEAKEDLAIYNEVKQQPFFQQVITAIKRKLHLEKWFDDPNKWYSRIGRLWTKFEGKDLLDDQFKEIYTKHCDSYNLEPRQDMIYRDERGHGSQSHDVQSYDDIDLSF